MKDPICQLGSISIDSFVKPRCFAHCLVAKALVNWEIGNLLSTTSR